jgi:hypothetical protein
MYQQAYRIKKAFLIALSCDIILLFLLLSLSFSCKSPTTERVIIALMTIIALFFFSEVLSRKILTGNQGILTRKFFRNRELLWSDITHVGIIALNRRVYALLTTTKGFHIFSNSYENFPSILREMADHVGRDKMDEDVFRQIEHPINKVSDIISAWFAAAVLVVIIVLKLIAS